MKRFIDEWKGYFGDLPPYSHYLRNVMPERWVRFHALPDAKRYAETPEEEAVVFDRGRILGNRILKEGQKCLFVEYFPNFEEYPLPYSHKLLDQFRLKYWFKWKYEEDPFGEQETIGFYGNEVRWFPEVYRGAFKDAAHDDERFLLMNRESSRILAPYDGGFDCFLLNAEEVTRLKSEFEEWLSPCSSGL
ncbi:hypothetical protein ACMG4P_25330 [Pseudovibrio denitrificans]|uniref:DUF3885 domain-containing protein n=1 Tax=Pseudovibrio denitrificans TaxID=258256 RepID=UPI0039BFBEDA